MIKIYINSYSGFIILYNKNLNFMIHLIPNSSLDKEVIYKKINLNFNPSDYHNWIDLDD